MNGYFDLAARLRPLFAGRADICEQKMFGGTGFMLNGNLLVGTMKGGDLLVRVSPDTTAEALAQPGARPLAMGSRRMKGFIGVSAGAIDDAAIARWIAFAESHVRTLPTK